MAMDESDDAMLALWERWGRVFWRGGDMGCKRGGSWSGGGGDGVAAAGCAGVGADLFAAAGGAAVDTVSGGGGGGGGGRCGWGGEIERFIGCEAGTIFLGGADAAPWGLARRVAYAARRTGRWLEVLGVVAAGGRGAGGVGGGCARFAAGLRVRFTKDAGEQIGAATEAELVVPWPGAGWYESGNAMARESIVIAWEALALKWQRRHAKKWGRGKAGAWEEIAWLRRALVVDAACEPVAMRLMAVAEGIERMTP